MSIVPFDQNADKPRRVGRYEMIMIPLSLFLTLIGVVLIFEAVLR